MGFSPSKYVPDSDYLLERSTTEARLAANARTEGAAAAHRKIASCYLAKLFSDEGAASSDHISVKSPEIPARSGAIAPSGLRFADLSSIPENNELTRILQSLP